MALQPGKLDLVEFMEKNYMFNLSLEKFGYLTGRSLTTFKKDFEKVFQSTPGKWLTHKRLQLAHYQILEKKENHLMFILMWVLRICRISRLPLKSSSGIIQQAFHKKEHLLEKETL